MSELGGRMNKFRKCNLVPFVIFLAFVSCILIVIVGKARLECQPSTDHCASCSRGNDDSYDDNIDTNICNFEDYVFGQPIKQDDPCFIDTFKKKILIPPPPISEQNFDFNVTTECASNIEKFNWVRKLLVETNSTNSEEDKPKGFFIECGANDGTFISPTLRLEKELNWTGLLIEANPIPFESLISKKRNAWAANVAMCTKEHLEQITFYTNPKNTGLSGFNARENVGVNVSVTVQCIPLYTMLKALDITTVDYFSLDVEGLELEILKTVPFDKITFKILTIEYILIPGKQQALKEFLEPRGYRFVKEINDRLSKDCLYVHESLFSLASSITI